MILVPVERDEITLVTQLVGDQALRMDREHDLAGRDANQDHAHGMCGSEANVDLQCGHIACMILPRALFSKIMHTI